MPKGEEVPNRRRRSRMGHHLKCVKFILYTKTYYAKFREIQLVPETQHYNYKAELIRKYIILHNKNPLKYCKAMFFQDLYYFIFNRLLTYIIKCFF